MSAKGIEELLANGVLAKEVIESEPGTGIRTLLYYERIDVFLRERMSSSDLAIEMMGHHMSIASSLVAHEVKGCYDIEVTLAGLTTHNEFYSGLAWTMLKNGISMKMHIVLCDDDIHNQYNQHNSLKIQLSMILAIGVTFTIANADCIEHIEIANEILDIANEVRLDLSREGYVDMCAIQQSLSSLSGEQANKLLPDSIMKKSNKVFNYSLIN